MVEVSPYSTLYENFDDGGESVGNGTNNHAWSGGGLTILSQYVCGLEPIEAAWKTFKVKPQLGSLNFAETSNETFAGKISVKVENGNSGMDIKLSVPKESKAIVYVQEKYKSIKMNGQQIFKHKTVTNDLVKYNGLQESCNTFIIGEGEYHFSAD